MEKLEIAGYVIVYDREATSEAYSKIKPQPEECECWYCRNWVAGREKLLPQEVRDLLSKIGVPVSGEIEVWEVPGKVKTHIYGGWYYIVGSVIGYPAVKKRQFVLSNWRMNFFDGPNYHMPPFGDAKVFNLEFVTDVDNFIEMEPDVMSALEKHAPHWYDKVVDLILFISKAFKKRY